MPRCLNWPPAIQPEYHGQHLRDAKCACAWSELNDDYFRKTSLLTASYPNLFHLPGNELVLNLFHIHFAVVTARLRGRAMAQGESDEKAADVVLLGNHIAA